MNTTSSFISADSLPKGRPYGLPRTWAPLRHLHRSEAAGPLQTGIPLLDRLIPLASEAKKRLRGSTDPNAEGVGA